MKTTERARDGEMGICVPRESGGGGGMNAWEREGGVGFSVSLKEKASEDGGGVLDGEAQEGGMDGEKETAQVFIYVYSAWGKRKWCYVCKTSSDRAATVTRV